MHDHAKPRPTGRWRRPLATTLAVLAGEGRWLRQGLRHPALYAILLAALAGWALAWQAPQPLVLDLGGPADNAYVFQFYGKEPDPKVNPAPPFKYRWSQAHSTIRWPGLGAAPLSVTLRLAGARPSGPPPAGVTVTVRGQTFPVALTNDLRDYAFPAGPGDSWSGDLTVRIDAPTFQAPGDPRPLGVLAQRATVTPQPGALVVPPLGDLGAWAVSLALVWLLAWRLSGRASVAALVAAAGAAAVALGAATARPDLGLLAPAAPGLLLAAYLLGATTATLLAPRPAPAWPGGEDRPPSPARGGAGGEESAAAALVVAFLLRVGGMADPQFLTSDLGLHVNNLNRVLGGTWVWTGVLPNGAPQPYPPLPYLALAPFATLVPDLSWLIRAGTGLLDALCVLPLFILGRRLAGARAGSAAAGWIYALSPAPFVLFSAGNFAYLVAADVFTWTLAAWGSALLAPRVRPGRWLGLAVAFFLTFLGAYGILIAAVAVAGFFVVLALVRGPADLRRRALLVAGAVGLAGLAAFAVYYGRFAGILLAPAGGVSTKVTPPAAPLAALVDLLGRRITSDVGWAAALAGLAGWLAGRPEARGAGVLALATVLAGVSFAALSLVAGENIRYPLLVAPVVALGAGVFLARVGARGRAGRAWCGLVIGLIGWHLLGVWVPLILTHYH